MTVDELQSILVDPQAGILTRMLLRLEDVNKRCGMGEAAATDLAAFKQDVERELALLDARIIDLAKARDAALENVQVLVSKVEALEKGRPSRSRKKKEEPAQDAAEDGQTAGFMASAPVKMEQATAPGAAEHEEPSVIVPIMDTAIVAEEVEGTPITDTLALSLRNDMNVLKNKDLILRLSPELNPKVLDYVLSLTEEQMNVLRARCRI